MADPTVLPCNIYTLRPPRLRLHVDTSWTYLHPQLRAPFNALWSVMAHLVARLSEYVDGVAYLDGLGIAYIIVDALWTAAVFAGLAAIYRNRHLDFIRMRKPLLLVAAVLCIHVYLFLILLLYPLHGLWPCNLQWWIMDVYFPLGIALFSVHNIQLLSISYQQKQMMIRPLQRHRRPSLLSFDVSSWSMWWHGTSLLRRTIIFTIAGVITQVIVTLVVFLGSRKFHPSFGAFSHAYPPAGCGDGWEWFPTIIWQFLWTWGFGPYVLFKIRKIDDVHGWKLETSLAIIANLPGTILWLAASYSPAFQNVNMYWPSALWFAPGLVMMEAVLIFFPLFAIYTSKQSRQTAMDAIANWEKKKMGGGMSSVSMYSSVPDSIAPTGKASFADDETRSERRNMEALDRALQFNHEELLEYAATREFTAENIIFLRRARAFREHWASMEAQEATLSPEVHHQLLHEAKNIFNSSISIYNAQFPVNIESRVYSDLEFLLDSSPRHSRTNIITPFVQAGERTSVSQGFVELKDLSDAKQVQPPAQPERRERGTGMMGRSNSAGSAKLITFDKHVFDRAEQSVKYMVFTNTWSRFNEDLEKGSWTSSSRESS